MKVKTLKISGIRRAAIAAYIVCLCLAAGGCRDNAAGRSDFFLPGEIWPDNDSVHINAHGGGIMYYDGVYYWYGEHKGEKSNSALVGVMCYSSDDLYHWRNEGVVLPVDPKGSGSPIEKGCIIERPKVIRNGTTGKFVMYFHHELKGRGYDSAHVGIAKSDSPTGPFKFISSFRPNANAWPENMPPEQRQGDSMPDDNKWWSPEWMLAVRDGSFVRRDFAGGQMSRDMTLFVDDSGKAYHIYSSEENLTLHISELSEDYLEHTGRYVRVAPGGHNEAPAVFKKDGRYFMITSGCTGWDPNAARLFTADDIFGPWEQHPNPFSGPGSELTFRSQSTFVLPVAGKEGAYIYMGDRWTPNNPIDGRYIWLPIEFEDGLPVIRWHARWNLDFFN